MSREAKRSVAACSPDEPLQRRDCMFSKSIKALELAVCCVASGGGRAPKCEAWKGGRERDYVKGCNDVAGMQCMATACGAEDHIDIDAIQRQLFLAAVRL